jgi:hypothetical protein
VTGGGRGGTFSTCTNIFPKFFACVDNFFKYNPLHEFFLFQLIIFPNEKSLHEFFFSNFFVHEFFFFLFPLLDFYFCFFPTPPPITFLMVRPLRLLKQNYCFHVMCFSSNEKQEYINFDTLYVIILFVPYRQNKLDQ